MNILLSFHPPLKSAKIKTHKTIILPEDCCFLGCNVCKLAEI